MTPQQIVGLAARLFAIWLVVIAFQIFGIATAMNAQPGVEPSTVMYLMPALPLLLAAILWLFPMAIAHKLVPKTHDTEVLKMPAREAVVAAAAIIGLWVLVSTLPHLIASFGIALQGIGSPLFTVYFTVERKLNLLVTLLQVVTGGFLVCRPRFVARKICNAG